MKDGAYDFILKPLKRQAVVKSVRQAMEKASLVAENRALKARLAELAPQGSGGLLGGSRPLLAAVETLRQAAPTSATVLLTGESGTGKELAARLVHDLSPRAAGPFVPIHCAAIPETILESELFGYEKGAFTGATARKEGRFERADGGTLFLDEVGEMAPARPGQAAAGPAGRHGGAAGRHRAARASTCAWWRPPTRTWRPRSRPAASARTSSTGSTWCRCGCPRCGSGATTCRCWPPPSCGASPRSTAGRWRASRRRRWRPWRRPPGRATSASCSTPWSGRSSSAAASSSSSATCPRRCAAARRPAGRRAGRPSLTVPLGTTMDEVERLVIRETLRRTRGDKMLAAQLLGIAARTIYRKLDRDEEGRLLAPARRPGRARRGARRAGLISASGGPSPLPNWRVGAPGRGRFVKLAARRRLGGPDEAGGTADSTCLSGRFRLPWRRLAWHVGCSSLPGLPCSTSSSASTPGSPTCCCSSRRPGSSHAP